MKCIYNSGEVDRKEGEGEYKAIFVFFCRVNPHEMPAADIENFASGQFMKTFGCLQRRNPSS